MVTYGELKERIKEMNEEELDSNVIFLNELFKKVGIDFLNENIEFTEEENNNNPGLGYTFLTSMLGFS